MLSDVLKSKRKELGLTLLDIAKAMNVSEATVQRWESGNIKSIRYERITALSQILGVSPVELLFIDTGDLYNKFDNVMPISTKKIPFLGDIACGKPIYADEDRESYVEAGIITDTTRERLMELEATKGDIETEITKEKITRPLIKREQVIYYLEKFKGGDIEDKEYQRKIIDMFVSKVLLYDDKITITYNYSGDKKEVTADIIEEAAFEAASGAGALGSDKLPSSPPIFEKSNTTLFFVGGLFGIMCEIADKV